VPTWVLEYSIDFTDIRDRTIKWNYQRIMHTFSKILYDLGLKRNPASNNYLLNDETLIDQIVDEFKKLANDDPRIKMKITKTETIIDI